MYENVSVLQVFSKNRSLGETSLVSSKLVISKVGRGMREPTNRHTHALLVWRWEGGKGGGCGGGVVGERGGEEKGELIAYEPPK